MRMQVMQAQLIEQSVLDDLVRQQEGLDPDHPHQPAERARQVAVNENRPAVLAVAGDVGNVEIA